MRLSQATLDRLEKGFRALQFSGDPLPFARYIEAVNTWNSAYNLTAIKNPEDQIDRFIIDSLAILPYLDGQHILDVGSGAGIPGITLALACPDRQFTLLDSNGKKTRFLVEVKRLLNLSHVEVVQKRVEAYHPSVLFDNIVCCAFTQLNNLVQWTSHLLKKDGCWLAMKGRYPEEELKELARPFEFYGLHVPGIHAERCCVKINN